MTYDDRFFTNNCTECFLARTPRMIQCPQCGNFTCFCQIVDTVIMLHCSDCGFNVTEGSFLPPCKRVGECTLYIVRPDSPEKITAMAGALGADAAELTKRFAKYDRLKLSLDIRTLVRVCRKLRSLGIDCFPDETITATLNMVFDCPETL